MGSEPKDKFLSHNSDEVISIDSSKPEPGITKLADFPPGSMGIRSFALTGLFILALFYTLYFARVLVLPIMLALLLTFLLRPVVSSLKNFHIPEPLSAALVLLTFLGVVGYGAYQLSTPASEWIAKAPQTFNKIEDKLRVLRKPVTQVSKATEQVQNMANRKESEKTQVVELQSHNLRDILLGQTSAVITGAATMFILLYFLLASGDLFLLKLVKVMPTLQDKKRAVEIAYKIQQHISTYLFTVTLINSGLGLAIGVAMYFIGMPSPVLWGVMAGLLEYIPYLGATVGISVVTLVAIFTFDNLGHALLVPAVYFGLVAVEGNLIVPMVLGRRLTLNPVVVFIGLIFWGWMWGIVGILLAVPIIATFKIFCDYIESLSPIGEFLGR